MNKTQTFEQFLTTQSAQILMLEFVINLLLAGVLAYVLSLVYVRYGRSLSNRRSFSGNFVLIAMTTMVIITVVKSSLALSLGLVGALSIVRFRAAIKEPEELAYLFLNIAIGLGLGANQRAVTVIGFAVIVAVIWLRHWKRQSEDPRNLHLTVSSEGAKDISLESVVEILQKHATAVELKRFDGVNGVFESAFDVAIRDINKLSDTKNDLQRLGDDVRVTFIDRNHLHV